MSLLITTQAELLELVEELRGMATAAPTAKIAPATPEGESMDWNLVGLPPATRRQTRTV
jgi:hypothetical protein